MDCSSLTCLLLFTSRMQRDFSRDFRDEYLGFRSSPRLTPSKPSRSHLYEDTRHQIQNGTCRPHLPLQRHNRPRSDGERHGADGCRHRWPPPPTSSRGSAFSIRRSLTDTASFPLTASNLCFAGDASRHPHARQAKEKLKADYPALHSLCLPPADKKRNSKEARYRP